VVGHFNLLTRVVLGPYRRCQWVVPSDRDARGVSNQADYYSGHYQAYGLNIQAMCDPDLVFMYVAVTGSGKINDVRAFSCCTRLIDWFETLPNWCFVSADNAYPFTIKMLVPLNATELWSENHRTFNFYLSQLRIRIKMAFRRLTTKWRRLWTTLNFASVKNAKIIHVCTKLHNYVIRKSKEAGDDYGTVVMVMLLIPKAMESSHYKEEAQMVIVILVFYQHSPTLLSRHYFQQRTLTVAAAIELWQI
jgi:hypothetical protein